MASLKEYEGLKDLGGFVTGWGGVLSRWVGGRRVGKWEGVMGWLGEG